MNKQSSVVGTPKINIAATYLQVQRLRQIVQEAEGLRVPYVKPEDSRINPKRQRQSSVGSLTARG
jgi:hypothetical protein